MAFGMNPWNLLLSMRSVDNWSRSINSNLAGTPRVGFKQTEITFSGSPSFIQRPYMNPSAGIAIGDQAINVQSSRIDFSQGDIVESDQVTHIAIKGEGFFVTSKIQNPTVPSDFIYTRDGQFQVVNEAGVNYLKTKESLYVIGTAANTAITLANPLPQEQAIKTQLLADIRLAMFGDNQGLRYNRTFGSTYFDETPSSGTPIYNIQDTNGSGSIAFNKLEAANVKTANQLVGLSVNEKYFETLTKQLVVYLDNIDQGLRLFK